VDKDSAILGTDEAKRMCWARVKAVAHLDKTDSGIVALDDAPPFGAGKLTWDEPVRFLSTVAPYVYDVFCLITATLWANADDVNLFHVRTFWDRFKNGHTELKPPSFT
jgi:hypothetical protein